MEKHSDQWYNTTHEQGQKLEDLNQKASGQQERILQYFKENRQHSFTPHQINEVFPEYPITSIRRAMSNLTQQERLIKTDRKVMGKYGADNYCWKYKTEFIQSKLF